MTTFLPIPVPFPGEAENAPKTLDYFVWEIGVRWYQTTEGVLEVANLCAEAIQTLSSSDLKKLISQMKFSKGTLSKLGKIGRDGRLRVENVRPHLPHNYTILYDISRLTDIQLMAAIDEGVIRPDMQRKDLEAWLPKEEPEPKPDTFATVFILDKMSEADGVLLMEGLRKLAALLPMIEVRGKANGWSFCFPRPAVLAQAA